MMHSCTCFETPSTYTLPRNPSTPEKHSAPVRRDSFYTNVAAGKVRETVAEIGSQRGIVQLDCELEARIGNLQHDASKLVSKSFSWAAKGLPKLAKKTACIADYYFFSKWYTYFLCYITICLPLTPF